MITLRCGFPLRTLLCALSCILLTACTSLPPPEIRGHSAANEAGASGWQRVSLPAGQFVLASWLPESAPAGDTLTIYIEGDGLAWISSVDVSPDPTPLHPVGLQLALKHPRGNAAYLARPCQYVSGDEARNCSNVYWTDKRFAPEVVEASNLAIDQLKQRFKATRLVLVGFSGGGAVAALVAARRHDVMQLVTVAGNLDHVRWSVMHNSSPLTGSLNPIDVWRALENLPQIHYVGGNDEVVPRAVAESFVAAFPADHRPAMRVIEGVDHGCCWADKWSGIYSPPEK